MGVNHFKRDLRDFEFVLFEHLGLDRVTTYQAFQNLDQATLGDLLKKGLSLAQDVLGPTLQDGDRIGCVREGAEVRVPPSFQRAWRELCRSGWLALGNNPRYGGGGLPALAANLLGELLVGSNLALVMIGGLTVGNARVIESFGTDSDRELFCQKLYTGQWGGTMCLTEPHAGSDVGRLLTSAVPDGDSSDPRIYKIKGQKRFISGGQQDLTENIIHLVLARIEGAPQGTQGISLFIVPKIWVEPDGGLGEPNDVACVGLEEKMGLHGSPTCALKFGKNDSCRGILLGEPQTGMKKMFQLMNEARLYTGLMGLGLAASAYDTARIYAQKRVQGPPFSDRKKDAVPIIRHADVRRMLMNLKSGTEGMRALIAWVNLHLDVANHDPDPKQREKALALVELMTPVVKTYCTDKGFELIRDAIQVLGGNGYCSQFPTEQYARDAKVLSVWEGTSFIQALDLVGRKLPRQGGEAFRNFIQGVLAFTNEHKADADFAGPVKILFKAAQATGDFAQRYMKFFLGGKATLIELTATRFLECLAEVAMARLLLEQGLLARAKLAREGLSESEVAFYRGKMETAKFFCCNILPSVFARYAALEAEDLSAVEIPEEALLGPA